MIKFLKSACVASAFVYAGLANAASTTFDFTSLTPALGGATGIVNATVGCGFNSGFDICGTAMTFQQGSLSAVATGTYLGASTVPVRVVQDYWYTDTKGTSLKSDDVLRYVGLGVYHKVNDTSDDNVTNKEVLTLTFNQDVKLTGLVFRKEGHGIFDIPNKTYVFGGNETTLTGNVTGLSVVGKTFTFGYGGARPEEFYLSAMTVTAVPEPETYAMLLAGLGVMGAVARRRKAKQTA